MTSLTTSRRRGVALVLVLWLLVILGGVAASVLQRARATTGLAGNERARLVARYAAEGAILRGIAEIERTLETQRDSLARRAYLNSLPRAPFDTLLLGNGRAGLVTADPSTQLDVNSAPAANLATLLSRFADIGRATQTANAIRAYVERAPVTPGDGQIQALGSQTARFVTPLRSLDELRSVPGVDAATIQRAAPYLTIDGDGTINRQTASDTVLAAAFGELRDEPSRLVFVARGWYAGHPLTHEIQAVYAISGTTLVLVHWRERDL